MIKKIVSGIMMSLLLVSGITTLHAEAAEQTSARIIVTGYEITEGECREDENMTLTLHLANQSATNEGYDILFCFADGNTDVLPAYGSSNQVYLSSLAPGEEADVDIQVKVNTNILSNMVKMPYTINYADASSSAYINSGLISIPLGQESVLSIDNITVADTCMLNGNTLINFTYSNAGTDTLRNVILNVEGSVPEEQKEIPLGDLEGGQSVNKDQEITINQAGSQVIRISLSYEDGDGVKHTIGPMQYEIEVLTGAALQPDVTNEKPESALMKTMNFQVWQMVIIGVVVVLAVGIGFLLFGKKRNYVK